MEQIAERILLYIRDDLQQQRSVDVTLVAEKLRKEFPNISMHDASERVFRTVLMSGGDFEWNPERSAMHTSALEDMDKVRRCG